jgi:hypothetical protein
MKTEVVIRCTLETWGGVEWLEAVRLLEGRPVLRDSALTKLTLVSIEEAPDGSV